MDGKFEAIIPPLSLFDFYLLKAGGLWMQHEEKGRKGQYHALIVGWIEHAPVVTLAPL